MGISEDPKRQVRDLQNALTDLTRQLNYIVNDIYSLLDEVSGTQNYSFTDFSSTSGFGTSSELTIVGGEITVTGTSNFRHHTIDTEADAASDALTKINGGNNGELMMFSAASGARSIVLTNGSDIVCGANFTLNNIADLVLLKCHSDSVWHGGVLWSNGN